MTHQLALMMSPMTISPGTTLGTFEITGLIGAGGMGEVYRATDTKLGREVAIKVLPEVFARDRDRLARFEREAKLLASLDHPNIAAIYDLQQADDVRFLVMQLIEGQTLAERIQPGSIPVDEVLPLFAQIAEAMEAAHEQGIIHRDLKPANIKITPDGKVKVLDFGLAKAFESKAVSTVAETVSFDPGSAAVTAEGKVMGTAAYMSPEQAREQQLDKRTDIWSFGCCLYEALTGQRPFAGDTATDLLADILKGEPNWDALPKNMPTRVRDLLWRCLQKDPRRRLRDIGDAWLQISETSSATSGPFQALGPTLEEDSTAPRGYAAFILIGLIGLVLGGGLLIFIQSVWLSSDTRENPDAATSVDAPRQVTHFSLTIPSDQTLLLTAGFGTAISPTTDLVAYCAYEGPQLNIYVRPRGERTSRVLPGTEGGVNPLFSPDGEWIAFCAGGKLKKVGLNGEPPVTLCNAPLNWWGGHWAATCRTRPLPR